MKWWHLLKNSRPISYDGSPKDWTISSSLGLSSSDFVFQYYGRITTHYLMSSTAPTDAGEYTVQVTLNNPNYTGGTVFEDFTILKATPANVTAPTASAITLGQDLAQSSLTGGSAEGVDGNALSGTFAFDDSTLIPSSTGSYSAGVTFTPDSANYETVSLTVSVTVNAATTPAEDYLADFGLTGANALLTADPDGDGLWNINEYRARLNPTQAATFEDNVADGARDSDGDGHLDWCEVLRCDLNLDGYVDSADLGLILGAWGATSGSPFDGDVTLDGIVNGADLGMLLTNWGPVVW
jgi:PKD repeat protein